MAGIRFEGSYQPMYLKGEPTYECVITVPKDSPDGQLIEATRKYGDPDSIMIDGQPFELIGRQDRGDHWSLTLDLQSVR